MPFLKREHRTRIYYEVHGSGTPLLLTHGYSSTSAMWQGQVDAFTKAGFKLIIWDMRGHGRSAYPDDQSVYSEAHTVADMAALLDHICGEGSSAIVGGLSLGGYMSQAFYRVHEARVQALLIIDTGPGFKSSKAREGWNKYANETADQFDREGLKQLQNSTPERAQVKHRNAEGLAMAARGMLAQRDDSVINALPAIKVPSLVVVGADDKGFLNAAEYMAKKIPDCKKVVIPGAGHAVNMDQPEAFNAAVLEFLEAVKGRGGSSRPAKL
ncbi:uncharacterized protein LTR77_003843 [Saxophila tyrrhenica]|uniref:AB hydrolase-1 domain-containing protein n=1 Tax=Saxophila tyrrhenica TaxID=1690608 RepID=A0AAV9PFB3_9PEZI|nr:hypothetical protein LTR77_003843 [Saxophila tyrrhenica]